ncbi:MAG: response regulator [Candidatus Wallbacteria bacterium]
MDGKKAILMVDDDESIVFLLQVTLSEHYKEKYAYETALNANEAMDIIDELAQSGVEVILILSDWLMPGIKGDEFLIKVHEKYPGIKAIMISGYADSESVIKMREKIKLSAFINKPWNVDDLISEVDKCLG